MSQIKIGDKVQYTVQFLRSCGIFTGPISFLKGTVKSLSKLGPETDLASIKWDNDPMCCDELTTINVKNIKRVGDLEAS